jgi:hypothetical protein
MIKYKIVAKKERDYKEFIGELQFWEESDKNLTYSINSRFENIQGKCIGSLRFDKGISKKEAKEISKQIINSLSKPNEKVKTVKWGN